MATAVAWKTEIADTGYNEKAAKELVGRAKELYPVILKGAETSSDKGRLSDEVVDALTDAGFWDMALPRRWGGYGTSCRAMSLVGAELARADPSVGWVYTVYHGSTWAASLTPDATQEALFGDGKKAVICAVANPPGKLEPVDGGYLLTGRWPYASGCYHADWAQVGCNIHHPDGRVEHGGNAYVRMENVAIEETWHMMGMKGTGSNTISVDQVFIPHAQFDFVAKNGMANHHPGKRHVGEAQDYWPFMPFLRATAHCVVGGAALEILDRVTNAMHGRKILYTTYNDQSQCVNAQAQLGEAAARIHAAIAVTLKNVDLVDEVGLTRQPLTAAQRALSKAEGSVAVDLVAQAVDKLMFLAGSSAFNEANHLQRLYRDCVVGLRHTANLPYVGYEILGKALLGITPNIAHPDFI